MNLISVEKKSRGILDRGYSAALAAKYIVNGICHHHPRFVKIILEYPLFADASIV